MENGTFRVPAAGSSGLLTTSMLFGPIVGVVVEHDLERVEDGHCTRRAYVQVLADEVLEQAHIHEVLAFGDADLVAEPADGFGRVAAAPHAAERRHARVVPAVDVAFVDELQQLALAHHRVAQVEPCELDLPGRSRHGHVVDQPVVEWTMILELERAERVRDALDRV